MKKNIVIAVLAVALVAVSTAFAIKTKNLNNQMEEQAKSAKFSQDFGKMVQDEFLRCWTNTVKKLRLKGCVVFFGDSITAFSDFQEYFPDKKVVNLGFPGDCIDGMCRRACLVEAAQPSKVFIMGGINDHWSVGVDQIAERYDSLLTKLATLVPDAEIYVQSTLPVNHEKEEFYSPNDEIAEGNVLVKEIVEKHGCTFINLYDAYFDPENKTIIEDLSVDGVHLQQPSGYDKWAEIIKPYVYKK